MPTVSMIYYRSDMCILCSGNDKRQIPDNSLFAIQIAFN